MSKRLFPVGTRHAIDDSVILRLINAATYAPSAMNQQPWTFPGPARSLDLALLEDISRAAKASILLSMSAPAMTG
uniref:nitroreductase family protein n=1 Tax=Pseudomonas sp. LF-5 TaxID=3031121 RepID=UPI0030EECCD7